MSPWIISRWVRFRSVMEVPASASMRSRSMRQFFCCRRYSLRNSSDFEFSNFSSSDLICRSSVRIASTVLLTLSSSRFFSELVYLNSRMMRLI